ncbi:hypothetical protein [Stenomitos frigidus]|uniref:hypothetical protein n=1 Tax=Stenomitos frigidus TaxID=1886765 RepID=UPI001FEC0D63|nr:hypothetical protein [Stenomitos frigidus]
MEWIGPVDTGISAMRRGDLGINLQEVANSASKFGLRGVVHALREELRSQQIGVTVINPDNVGTPEVLADLAADNLLSAEAIPLTDLLSILDCILSLSRATCLKEIGVPAMLGKGD